MLAPLVLLLLAAPQPAPAQKAKPAVAQTVTTKKAPARKVRTARVTAVAAKSRLDRVIDLATSDCARTPEAIGCANRANGRHRLPLREIEPIDHKADALAETGRPCALVGPTICQGRRQTILRADENGETQVAAGSTPALTSPGPAPAPEPIQSGTPSP